MVSRREILFAAGAGAIAGPGLAGCAQSAPDEGAGLSPITGEARAITSDERRARIARLQGLMGEAGVGAILIEPSPAMDYFTGLTWWLSERLTAVVIPAEGDIAVVTPQFEEPSIRERLVVGDDVRLWNEHQSPFERVAGILADRGVADRPLALEATTRHFVVDGLARAMPGASLVTGEPLTRGCRMYKSDAELALMQTAADVTMAAYAHVRPRIETGMTPADIAAMMNEAQTALGARPTFAIALVGEAAAYPHGSNQPQEVAEGEVILMDCGCEVHGYQSDISRTFVHGEPSARQRTIWNTVKRGQEIVMETALVGTPAGAVDDAVRAYYESEGWGPGYATPGLSHRTGHGIGMEVHEQVNFVHGETTPLAPGMCFSNEPGIYIPGELGVRLEDCIHITEDGPRAFSGLAASIDDPMG